MHCVNKTVVLKQQLAQLLTAQKSIFQVAECTISVNTAIKIFVSLLLNSCYSRMQMTLQLLEQSIEKKQFVYVSFVRYYRTGFHNYDDE